MGAVAFDKTSRALGFSGHTLRTLAVRHCRLGAQSPRSSGARARQGALFRPRAGIAVFLMGLALILGGTARPVAAAPATYSGEARVTSQSEAERAGALKSALADVVIRLSGDAGILARSDVARAVAEADKYVLQYSYRRDAGADEANASAPAGLVLVAEFDSGAVDRMLGGLGLGANGAPSVAAAPVEKRIWISGIHSAADYARGLGYLQKQSLVRQSWPVEARGDGILVRLTVAGDFARWLAQVDQDAVLRVNSASPPLDGVDATLVLSP